MSCPIVLVSFANRQMPVDGVVVVDVDVVVVEVVVDGDVIVVVDENVDVEEDGYSQQSSQVIPGSIPQLQLSIPQTRGPSHSPSLSQSPSPSPHGPKSVQHSALSSKTKKLTMVN